MALAGWNGALAHSLLLPSSNDMRPSCPESLAVGAYSARAMPPGFGSDGAAGSCNFVWRIAGCADTTSSDSACPKRRWRSGASRVKLSVPSWKTERRRPFRSRVETWTCGSER